jgi:hypothetical protein
LEDNIIKTFLSLSSDINNKINKNKINDRNMLSLFFFVFILNTEQNIYLIDLDKNPKLNSIMIMEYLIF